MTTLALIGGFLGAGKTTLILRAAAILRARGKRVAVVLNDQDSGLVDTRLAEAHGVPWAEVAGGCFCCRLRDLLHACDSLRPARPDVVFAEAVGSCIDLAATVIRPLQAGHSDFYRLAPLTVLVDPGRAACYLSRNQIDEADIVCATSATSIRKRCPPLTFNSAQVPEPASNPGWMSYSAAGVSPARGSSRSITTAMPPKKPRSAG